MSNDTDLRFFLAHDRADSDEDIDTWRDRLTELLSEGYPGREVTVVAGRDDYLARAKDAGGWKGWPRSVFSGTLFDGETRFHGVIRPVSLKQTPELVCGKPTFEMIEGFINLGKSAWVWDTVSEQVLLIDECVTIPGENFKTWGRLVTSEPEVG
jgi:hypothetical protein